MGHSPSATSSDTPSFVTPPPSDLITFEKARPQDGQSDAVPWPGHTYKITEQNTGLLIAVQKYDHRDVYPKLLDPGKVSAPDASWLCVEDNGYFGFLNQHNNVYLNAQVPTPPIQVIYESRNFLSSSFGPDQYFIPREYPNGGYQLLSPADTNSLKHFAYVPAHGTFVKRQHAGTVWRFIRVSTGEN